MEKNLIDFRKNIGYYSMEYPALDPTTPHYEFNCYVECCESLGVSPSLHRFMAYQRYYKNYGSKQKSSSNN
jgi:hypothetical protein